LEKHLLRDLVCYTHLYLLYTPADFVNQKEDNNTWPIDVRSVILNQGEMIDFKEGASPYALCNMESVINKLTN